MAALTDEQKAAIIAGPDDDTNPTPGQGTQGEDDPAPGTGGDDLDDVTLPPEDGAPDGDEPADGKTVDAPADGDTPPDGTAATFTKKFSNLQGENWEEYGTNLETAYQNSFTEGIRLADENRKLSDEVEQYRTYFAQGGQPSQGQAGQPVPGTPGQPQTPGATQPGQPQAPQVPVAPNGIQATPEFQWLQSQQAASMKTAFGKFMEVYPQVTEDANFQAFKKAVTPVTSMFAAVEGRQPTYEELFPKVADVLGWQPAEVTGKRDQTIKDAVSQQRTQSATQPPSRQPNVNDAELTVFMRMNPGIKRDDAVKEIARIKSDPMAATLR